MDLRGRERVRGKLPRGEMRVPLVASLFDDQARATVPAMKRGCDNDPAAVVFAIRIGAIQPFTAPAALLLATVGKSRAVPLGPWLVCLPCIQSRQYSPVAYLLRKTRDELEKPGPGYG